MKRSWLLLYFTLLFLFVSCHTESPYVEKPDEDSVPHHTDADEEPGSDDEEYSGDNDDESVDDADDPAEGCVGFSLPLYLFERDMRTEPEYFERFNNLGNPYTNDSFEIYFRDKIKAIEGKHILGKGDNASEETCTACVTLVIDAYQGGFYFAESGELTVDYFDPLNYGIKGSISAKLKKDPSQERPGYGYNYTTADCYEIEGDFDITCLPKCSDKECGDDQCGRTCGECTGNSFCTSYQKCAGSECKEISVEDFELADSRYVANVKDNAVADKSIPDTVTMSFYDKSGWSLLKYLPEGTFNISSEGYDAPFKLKIDMCEDFENQKCTRHYYLEQGTMTIETAEKNRLGSVGSASVKLVNEEYGFCYEINDMTWNTLCKPDCTDRICGNDGCGGSCGECGDGMTCSEDQTECVPYGCTKIKELTTYDAMHYSYYDEIEKTYLYTPNTGKKTGDYLDMLHFYIISLADIRYNHDYELPVDEEDGLRINMYIEEDYGYYTNWGYDYSKLYHIENGTINFESIDSITSPYLIKAEIRDLRFVEVEKDKDGDYVKVDGGSCIEFSSGKFNNF